MEQSSFQTWVQIAIDREATRELAEHFEIGESTVARWADGTSRPHPKIAEMVVEYIKTFVR